MKFQPRKAIRLPRDQYVGRRIYFVTICCENRRRILANPSNSAVLVSGPDVSLSEDGFIVHAYCVMPNHLHILVEGQSTECNLRAYMTKLKQKTGYSLRGPVDGTLWQNRYYDHILRKAEDSDSIAWYIWMNPVRQGLVGRPSHRA